MVAEDKESQKQSHAQLQSRYFDERASFWLQPIPQEIQERTRRIVKAAQLTPTSRVLDVGTGAGVLIGHFLEEGVPQKNVVGCDLSANMLANARSRYPQVHYFNGDILQLASESGKSELPEGLRQFDAVFFNACFGNIFDQFQALKGTSSLLARNGRIVISHPLGAGFAAGLRKNEPEIVPHLFPLPEKLELWAKELNLRVEQLVDDSDFYLAVLKSQAS